MAISIHAPREGSDKGLSTSTVWPSNFYPRSPRGERLGYGNNINAACNFYPRSPRGERQSDGKTD